MWIHFHRASGGPFPRRVSRCLTRMPQLGKAALTHLEEDLAWALADRHGAHQAVGLARAVIDLDAAPLELLGVVEEGAQAVYWDLEGRQPALVDLDTVATADVFEMDLEPDRKRWLDPPAQRKADLLGEAALDDWLWVHPRQRWRVD